MEIETTYETEIHRRYMFCSRTEKIREVYIKFGKVDRRFLVVRFVYPDGRIHPMQPPVSRLFESFEQCVEDSKKIKRKVKNNV